jgi:anti-sigma factor RsiW
MNDSSIWHLIQIHCDGESTPEQEAALQERLQHRADLQRALEDHRRFVQSLRSHTAGVMREQCPCCPDAVVQTIKSCISTSPDVGARAQQFGRSGPQAHYRRWAAAFSAPVRVNGLAVAATLALIAGAILYGIFGPSIDDVRPPRSADLAAIAAQIAANEHARSASEPSNLDENVAPPPPEEVERNAVAHLGVPIQVFDLTDAGYHFVRAERCDMGLTEPAYHLLYRKVVSSGQRVPMASVYVMAKSGGCGGLCAGKKSCQWYPVVGAKCKQKVLHSTDGKRVYFLVCCAERDLPVLISQMRLVAHADGH